MFQIYEKNLYWVARTIKTAFKKTNAYDKANLIFDLVLRGSVVGNCLFTNTPHR